jgi:hypothetical protein
MSNAALVPSVDEDVLYPPPVALGQVWPWVLFGLACLALVYLVGVEEGALSVVPGTWVHEWLHDGRHLMAVPCH